MNGLDFIKSKQQSWAKRKNFNLLGGIIPNRGEKNYLYSLADNLFEPLSKDSLDSCNSSDGNETKDSKTRLTKMKAHQFLLSFFLLLCISAIVSVLLAQDSKLPEKAKLETILYQDADMIGIGYVHRKQFVENQHVTFICKSFRDKYFSSYRVKRKNERTYLHERKSNTWEDLSSLTPLISGIYFTRNDTSYIRGVVNPFDGLVCEGVFIFYNSEHGSKYFLSPLVKKDQKFSLDMNGTTSYQLTVGRGYKAHGKSLANGYSLKIEFPDKSDILTLEGLVAKLSDLKNFRIYDSDCLKNLGTVKIKFANGDNFNGTVTSIYASSGNELMPLRGKYTYSTGEEFIGEYSRIKYDGKIYVPKGIITFSDGVVASNDWLSKYNFTNKEWKQIYDSCNGLTEIRDMAAQLELKKQQEKIAEQRAEQLKRRKEEEQRRNIISKYGEHYGALIIKKKLIPGMSQAMVNEVWSKDFFDCSISTSSGRRIEVWSLNNDKMQIKIASEANKVDKSGEATVAAMLLMNLLGSTSLSSVPNMLVFVNDKLTDIYK